MSDEAQPRVLVRHDERGPSQTATHPWNPASEVHGWMLSRAAGLERIAVNLLWLPPGREAFAFHRHFREEEWLYVLEGQGVVRVDGREHEVGAGDFLGFPPGVAHLLRNTGTKDLMYLGGGEIIEDVEVADFPELDRRMTRTGPNYAAYVRSAEVPFVPELKGEPPRSTARVLVRSGERGEARVFQHPDNPNAEVFLTQLSRPAGLKRVAVVHSRLLPGKEAYAYHLHHHDEEWLYVLSGRGFVEVNDVEHQVGPGDFLGFPTGVPHNSRADSEEPLVYLQGGDAWSRKTIEIVDLPRLGLRRTMVGTKSALTFPLSAALELKR